jgi:hypothetical protein
MAGSYASNLIKFGEGCGRNLSAGAYTRDVHVLNRGYQKIKIMLRDQQRTGMIQLIAG